MFCLDFYLPFAHTCCDEGSVNLFIIWRVAEAILGKTLFETWLGGKDFMFFGDLDENSFFPV